MAAIAKERKREKKKNSKYLNMIYIFIVKKIKA